MADVSLEMLMVMLQRLLEDVRLLKDAMTRVERYVARSDRRDAETLGA